MTDQPYPHLHDDVMESVRRQYPRHSKFTPFVWQQIAAIAGDDYRPEISDEHYRALLDLRVHYAVEGYTSELHRDINSLRSQIVKRLPTDGQDDSHVWFLYRELVAFDEFVLAEEEVPFLESVMLEATGDDIGIDLLNSSAEIRSKYFRRELDNPLMEWDGLPNSLMRFAIDEFPDHFRVDPFWERLQREVAPNFQEAALRDKDYRKLLRLQVRYFGFCESAAVLMPLAEAMMNHLDQPSSGTDARRQETLRQLMEFTDALQRPPPSLGRG